jgi:lipopolysaccharide transport system ATP-binding protein
MSNKVITVEHLSKSYILKHQNTERYTALRDVITNKVKSVFSSNKEQQNLSTETFWALNDVSFEINQGDKVGIIGRNGAGKSTLLKVLSRIVTPTKGRITIEGRVASLLEVGTGFHPELTGRENIFLNGAILGMSKNEIQRKFDEIVAFSEVERFLDTPVKRYSSGMYVRLAFAVAAHLEPEILIVDEVLAVGDAEFQKKCLGKMKDVAGEGRTVLFVSHNMAAVRNLCDKAILMNKGSILKQGSVDMVMDEYLNSKESGRLTGNYIAINSGNEADVKLIEAQLYDSKNNPQDQFEIIEDITIKFKIKCNRKVPNLYAYIAVKNSQDELFIESDTIDFLPNILDDMKEGINSYSIKINANVLAVGEYVLYLSLASSYSANFLVETPGDILRFTVVDSITERGHQRKAYTSQLLKWQNSF